MRHDSRRLRLSAIILGFSVIAAACGGDDGEDAGSTETTEEESALAPPELGDAAPTCEGESDGVLTFGGLYPETGDLSFLAPPATAGTTVAINEINENGGVLGQEAVYMRGDSGDGDPDIANPTVDGHLRNGADVILGALASGVSQNVIDKVTDACTLMFSPGNTSPLFTDWEDDDLFFRTAPSDILQGRVLSSLMLEDGVATAAILARQDAYGEGLLEFTQTPFEESGGEVVVSQTYDPEGQTFEAEVNQVISEDPDALVMIGFDESFRILQSLFEQGFTPDEKKIYLVDGNVGNGLGEDFIAAGEEGVLVGVKGTLPAAELSDEFRERLLGVDPELQDFHYGPESYDAVMITALAAAAAGTDDPAAIAAEINAISREGEPCTGYAECLALVEAGTDIDYSGPSGPQDFSRPGEPMSASFAVMSYGEDNLIDDSQTFYREASLG